MKKCSHCQKHLPLEEFHSSSRTKDGKNTWCKLCNKTARLESYRKNRAGQRQYESSRKLIQRRKVYAFLSTHPCIDCGETDPVVLQFDHVRGSKIAAISRMVASGFGGAQIDSEIEKCEVRCANCHMRKTAKERGYYSFLEEDIGA